MKGRFVHGAYIEPSWVKHAQPFTLEERVKSLECHIDDIYEMLLEIYMRNHDPLSPEMVKIINKLMGIAREMALND